MSHVSILGESSEWWMEGVVEVCAVQGGRGISRSMLGLC